MRLILVRHGETKWNALNKLQSFTDIELNEIGRSQAKKARDALVNEKIDLVISSPLSRAYETAQIINENHNKEHNISEHITERNFGDLEGIKYQELHDKMKKIFDEDLYDDYKIERVEDIEKRLKIFFNELKEKHFGENILIVAHSSVLKSFLAILLEKPLSEIRRDVVKKNCSISVVEFDSNYKQTYTCLGIDKHLS